DQLHGKTSQIRFTTSFVGPAGGNKPLAGGGMVSGGVAGQDSVPGLLMPGEVVVPAGMVRAGAVDHLRGMLPGFAEAGLIAYADRFIPSRGTFLHEFTGHWWDSVRTVVKWLAAHQPAGAGALGGDAAVNEALARRMFPWPATQWPPFVSLEMSEAGFNRFATNPTSGAYGLPQALPPTKMPFAAQAAGGSHAGPQLAWMFSYISGRYGNPANAWAWHLAHNWYDSPGGTWMAPGASVGLDRPRR